LDSTIWGGIARSDSTHLRALPSCSTESSLSSSDLPNADSQESKSDDDRTILTVATDTDASSIFNMLHDDPEFDSLCLNSVAASRAPEEVIAIDDLEEGKWTDEESIEDRAYKNVQELKILEVVTGSILTANRYEAHPDGGSQASTTNKSLFCGSSSGTLARIRVMSD